MHKVVLIGAGRIGHIHARNAALHPRIELAGVVDAVEASAQALASEYNSCTTTLEAALGDAEIDGVFVKDISENPADYAVVRSINEIGHYMGKKTVAEYVENPQTLASLKEIGVDYAQGYEISKPFLLQDLKISAAG